MEEAKRLIAEEIAVKPTARERALKDDDLRAIHDFIPDLTSVTGWASLPVMKARATQGECLNGII